MADVRLVGVHKSFGDVHVLRDINLEIRDGEFMVFVGPSGCGKSTLLRAIAGLEDISSGQLFIGSRLVNDVPPAERGISMVFQSYALYPHMDLYENMAFGLRLAKMPKDEIDRAVNHAAVDRNLAGARRFQPGDHAQQRRLAAARRADEHHELFVGDLQVKVLDHTDVAKPLVDVPKTYTCHCSLLGVG